MSNVPTNLIPSTITQLPEYQGSSTLGYFAYSLEGRSYKVQFSQLAAVGAVPSTRVIAAGTGLTGGGDLSQDRVISIANGGVGTAQLADSGVIAGSYGSGTDVPVLTVDAKGRITAASTAPLSISGYVPTSRTITTGAGLLGGGSLSSNLTLTVDFYSSAPQALGSASPGVSTAAARGDHVHPAVDLSDTDQTQGALPLGRGGTGDALSPVAGAVVYSTGTKFALADPGIPGQVFTSDGAGEPYWQTISGTGTVSDVSVVTANGFAGTVANANTTPAITINTTVTGLVKGNGTALSAAVAGTDYVAPGAITGSGLTMATSRLLGRTTASSGAVEEITVGTGLSLSGGSLANSAPDQVVSFTSGTGISVTGTYPAFTITNTAPDQVVSLTAGTDISVTGSYPNFTIAYTGTSSGGTVTSVAASGGTTGLTFSGSPITTSGTLTLGGTLAVASGGTGATTASTARANLGAAASGANSDITSLSGITGSIATVDSITFDTAAGVTVGQGQIAWNADDGTMNIGMGYDAVTQQVGLEQYYRIKASAAITNGQCVMFTGAVGASGVLTGAPATGVTNPQYIMGVATMDIALNGFGYITNFGLVRGIDTTGTSVGETWADGDILYYNPAYTGGLTKVEPVAPNPKVVVAAVANAGSGGSGSLFIRVQAEPYLQGLTDVYAPSPITNGQILIGDGAQSRWEAATLTAGTNVSITNAAGAITINATDQYTGTVTSVDVSGGTTGLTTSGGPVTSSGTITLGGTLAVANGGTGATSLTSGYLLKGNGTSAVSASVIYDTGTNVGIGTSSPFSGANSTNLEIANAAAARVWLNSTGYRKFYLESSSGNALQFVDGTAGAERMRIGSSGGVAIGGTGTDASLHIQQAYGGYDRLTQMSPSGTSKDAFNIIAAKNSGGTDLWWSWGVDTSNRWRLNQGVGFSTNGFIMDDVGQITSADVAAAIGYKGLPQNSQTSGYTLVLADQGKHISITTGGVTIPANGSVAFPVGTTIVVFNNSGSTQTIAITSDTLRQAGTTNTGTRTLAVYGLATLVKVASTTWVVTGNVS